MLFELLTEYKKPATINKIVSKHFDGFNTQVITDYWKGIKEQSLKISIIADNTIDNNSKVELIAGQIKALNNQEAVLINKIDNEYLLI